MKRNEFERALLTEMLPSEVPIVFSNDGFYRWVVFATKQAHGRTAAEQDVIELVTKLTEDDKGCFEPMKYSVEEGGGKTRELALLHPASQRKWIKFYQDYSGLLLYYCNVGEFSIRTPDRVASHVFVSGPHENAKSDRLTPAKVDVGVEDRRLRHPGSFFLYSGYSRPHKFLESEEFMRLERRYPMLYMFDVENCFGSIYTHSIEWAVQSKSFSKTNMKGCKDTFSRRFDDCMMHSNWRETNGIPVGPEISRLFAEVIFQAIDVGLAADLGAGQRPALPWEVKRYVDDYFVFVHTQDDAARIEACLHSRLREYGLRLSQGKTTSYRRPFVTKRDLALGRVRDAIRDLEMVLFCDGDSRHGRKMESSAGAASLQVPDDMVSDGNCEGVSGRPRTDSSAAKSWSLVPRRRTMRQSKRQRADFLRKIKSACSELAAGYDFVSQYVLGALERYVRRLCGAVGAEVGCVEDYRLALSDIIEVAFFLFCVQPSAESSLRVANICLRALHFGWSLDDDAALQIEQLIFEECTAFLSETRAADETVRWGASIDRLNLVGVLSQLKRHSVPWSALRRWVFPRGANDGSMDSELGYFQAIVCLHYGIARGEADVVRDMERVIVQQIENAGLERLRSESGLTHLVLDALSCEKISVKGRTSILRRACGLAKVTVPRSNIEAEGWLKIFVDRGPWFTDWGEVPLLKRIERKRAARAY